MKNIAWYGKSSKGRVSMFPVVVFFLVSTLAAAGSLSFAEDKFVHPGASVTEESNLDPLPFDRILLYAEMTDLLKGWAATRPDIMKVESIGRTPEGRDLWFVTLTNQATGPAVEKPALLVDGNMHAVEWAGGVAALNFIWRLVRDYGKDEAVTRLLDTRSVYVLPRFSPDGVEATLRDGRIIRSAIREISKGMAQNSELQMRDMDGDGRIVFMRFRDPNGPWKTYAEEPRLLVARRPEESGGDYWRVVPEGDIDGYDGETINVPSALQGIDFGTFFPDDREEIPPDSSQKAEPDLVPEVVSYVDAIKQRPNIIAHVTCHTFGGVFLTPPVNRDELIPYDDILIYRKFGEMGAELTGYPAITYRSLGMGLPPSSHHISTEMGWLYHIRGVFSFITEFWNPLAAAGIEVEGPMSSWLMGNHPIEDELQLLRWSDKELGGLGFAPWRPFDHPQLGPVEIGGWDKVHFWYNIPFHRLENEVAPHADWLIDLALATPRLQIRTFSASPEANGLWRLRLAVENTGWLPTFVSRKALERGIGGEITAQLSLPVGSRLVEGAPHRPMGQLEGRSEQRSTATWWGYDPGTSDRTFLEWLIDAPEGTEISVTVSHERAGTVREKLTLGSIQ
jgi:hypothetical protein